MSGPAAKNALFKVDSSKCLKCGLCVKDCAFRAITIGSDSIPHMPLEDKCMQCQHCFAICPTGAITFDGVKPEDVVALKDVKLPGAKEVENWMKTRRSIRHFTSENVERGVLNKILTTLANSPTGCNAHALTFHCYPDGESMNNFRSAFIKAVEEHRNGAKLLPRWLAIPAIRLRDGREDLFFRGASGMLIVSCDEKAKSVTTPNEDVTIACSNFELLANAHGISTCWCGFLKLVQNEIPELLEKAAGISRTTPFYAILFGKSAVKYSRAVERGSYAKIEYRDGTEEI